MGSVGATVAAQVGLQTASRKAMVEFIKELQESIEVARPLPGSTLNYFIARGRTNCITTSFLVKNAADSAAAGIDLYDPSIDHRDFGGKSNQVKSLSSAEPCTLARAASGPF